MIKNGDEEIPPAFQEIHYHMIFDAKMEDFWHNVRFVAGGRTTDKPHDMTSASVVSRESEIIALTLDALNDLDVNMDGIENAYKTAPLTEKVWTGIGPEFGDATGNSALIVRALLSTIFTCCTISDVVTIVIIQCLTLNRLGRYELQGDLFIELAALTLIVLQMWIDQREIYAYIGDSYTNLG
jgi:hypothetical protein